MDSNVSLWVLIGPFASVWVFMDPSSLFVLIVFTRFLWILISSYSSLSAFMSPYRSLRIPMRFYGSL